ncbi:MAG TPA: hypothetical protein VG273_22980 [Bryobacteraceae bacterium]|nr:hypothetical protein [Bryobacteraceae bacterium]
MGAAAALDAAATRSIERAGWRLLLDAKDNILSFRRGSLELLDPLMRENRPRVSGRASAGYDIRLIDLDGGAIALEQSVITTGRAGAREPITVDLPRSIRLPFANRSVFLALSNGLGWHGTEQNALPCAFSLAGGHGMQNPRKLALPLIDEYTGSDGLRIAYASDPFFSTGFGDMFRWVYSSDAPAPESDRRTVWTMLHTGTERDSLARFYETAVRRVRPGPAWLHDIALIDYDYLSDVGQGWYRDIATLEKLIRRNDRHKVLFVLHGWYGYIGRYTYDHRSGSLAKRWAAFPQARAPGVQQLANQYKPANPYSWRPEAVRALQPVELSLEEMHRRIRYGKDRGFRVALYYGDGLGACDGLKDIFDPSKVLRWGGWTLPDTLGRYYVQNPIHPDVRAFFQGYIQALLGEYGREVDGFVWDETFLITSGDLGTTQYPGYAARAMMRLVESLSVAVQEFRQELAFLTSDNLGLRNHDVPCALVAHGTYQDSAMFPGAWAYGLFPNCRNVMWSCNWAPIRFLERTRYAAETFDAPVSISNGYGEDLGVSEMSHAALEKIVHLFDRRKSRRMEISWIQETGGAQRYQGRPVMPRPA